ncbi:MAG: DUF4912 domain-containing protein [Nitrospirae bacterium]|nr:DUF4912 domain-containing protein [Nitrospirota bacterium]MBF0592376.1 DUF4912 domain-containing protein [Nitrospirota bacterium]
METNLNRTAVGQRIKTDDAHGITYLLSDTARYPINEEYEIPPKYDIDTIVALPVNENKIFLYWELTQRLLREFIGLHPTIAGKLQDPATSSLTVKVYELNAEQKNGNGEKEIWSTAVEGSVSNVYIPCTEAFRPMMAAIGVDVDGNFVELLRSNELNVPSFKVLGLKEEFWSKGVLLEDEKVADTPKDATVSEQTTDIFEKEMEIVSQLLEIRFKDTESIEVILGLIEKLKHLSGDDRTMLDLIKRFFETRVKDIQLLSLFLEFMRFLNKNDRGKGSTSVSDYFERLKDAAAMPGSSEMSSGQRG